MSTISNVNQIQFSRDWNVFTDFPTRVTNEVEVRANLQELHDQMKTQVNTNIVKKLNDEIIPVVNALEAEQIPEDSVMSNHIKDENSSTVDEYVEDEEEGTVKNPLAQGICTRHIRAGAVTAPKIASAAILTTHLNNAAVTLEKIADAVKSYFAKQTDLTSEVTTATTHRADTTVHITAAERTAWNAKQGALTFDTTPTASSTNPVTSGGIKTYVDTAVTNMEVTTNKVTSISSSSTDTEYPSAKLVYDQLATKQATLDADQIRKITISSSSPSGGSDGDIWFLYS